MRKAVLQELSSLAPGVYHFLKSAFKYDLRQLRERFCVGTRNPETSVDDIAEASSIQCRASSEMTCSALG